MVAAAPKGNTTGLVGLDGSSTARAYVAQLDELVDVEAVLTSVLEIVPEVMSMRMILRANPSETVEVVISGGPNDGDTYDLGVGTITEDDVPDYTEDGYSFVNATVGNDEVTYVGKWTNSEGDEFVYYSTPDSGDTAMLLDEGEQITLNYEPTKTI